MGIVYIYWIIGMGLVESAIENMTPAAVDL